MTGSVRSALTPSAMAMVDGVLERTPMKLPNHVFCTKWLKTWTEEISHESHTQKQCPACLAVFCNGTNNCTHSGKESEYLGYTKMTGIEVPNEFGCATNSILMIWHGRWRSRWEGGDRM